MGRGPWLSLDEQLEMWRRLRGGEPIAGVARAMGRSKQSVSRVSAASGGVSVWRRSRSRLALRADEREEISRGLAAGLSLRAIAGGLGRAPSTVSREVAHNGGPGGYRGWEAEARAGREAQRPKLPRLVASPRLREAVESGLERRWSPQQIARRQRLDHPEDPEMWVSYETIYQSLFVQGRGGLRRELHRALRTGRARRRPRRGPSDRHGHIQDMVLVSERPAEVEDRALPGHWEGDLIIGKNSGSAIGTLVERRTRYVMLVALPEGRDAHAVRVALTRQIQTLPASLRRSLTWDQGKEMSHHLQFSVDTGVQVYFCDPHSPWQRGSNENTNGLLRQYFPKATDLSVHPQAHLDAVADELNGRPRQTLGWLTPSEALAQCVAATP